MTTRLTPQMQEALAALDETWRSSYQLQVRMPTLDSLVVRGLAERRGERDIGAHFSPRTTIEYRLRPAASGLGL